MIDQITDLSEFVGGKITYLAGNGCFKRGLVQHISFNHGFLEFIVCNYQTFNQGEWKETNSGPIRFVFHSSDCTLYNEPNDHAQKIRIEIPLIGDQIKIFSTKK